MSNPRDVPPLIGGAAPINQNDLSTGTAYVRAGGFTFSVIQALTVRALRSRLTPVLEVAKFWFIASIRMIVAARIPLIGLAGAMEGVRRLGE